LDVKSIKDNIVTNVYQIPKEKRVPLHKHVDKDEVFYCIGGSGFGVLQDDEVSLKVGQAFIVPAGTMHALRTDDNLCVTSFLIPVITE